MSRYDKRGSSEADQVDSLLQRLSKQISSSEQTVLKPPEEASAAIGRRLAACFLSSPSLGDKILAAFWNPHINPSVPHAFFSQLSSQPILLDYLPLWILQCEEQCMERSGPFDTLYAAIRAYARCDQFNADSVADTFHRLRLPTSRLAFMREFIQMAFSRDSAPSRRLSPLMAACVLALATPKDEKLIFLHGVCRECWISIRTGQDKIVNVLQWMTKSLHMFLRTVHEEPRDQQPMAMELAYEWLLEITGMMASLENQTSKTVQDLCMTILETILPFYFTSMPHCRLPMKPVLAQLEYVLAAESSNRVAAFRLSTLALSTPMEEDDYGILQLLTKFSPCGDTLIRGMMHTLACIYAHNDVCKEASKQLYRCALSSQSTVKDEQDDVVCMVQLFQNGGDDESLLAAMTASFENMKGSQVSLFQQNAALLLGSSLFYGEMDKNEFVYPYLRSLVHKFPHLGVTLLPLLLQAVQRAGEIRDGKALIGHLEFMCETLVQDPQCAQEVWNLVGVTLMRPDSELVVRSVAIRMFPRLCASNKRLYRRIISTISAHVEHADAEMRLAVAATINDLARDDLIRDVSDVIAWIQTYLADPTPSVVHFAISSLHYLVVSQELDFDLVIKVLNKRLCPVGNVNEVMKLPGAALEALVLFLGDGECDDGKSDEEDILESKVSHQLGDVSPQVSAAVQTLIQLAQSSALCPDTSESCSTYTNDEVARIRLNIYKSLGNYSLTALGVDDQGIRSIVTAPRVEQHSADSIPEVGRRYAHLRMIAIDGIVYPPASFPIAKSDPTVLLARKLLAFEEDSLGSSLWQKGVKGPAGSSKSQKAHVSKSVLGALPSPDIVQGLYRNNPSSVTAIASLLSFAGESVSELFDIASDISNESAHPIVQAFLLQGWLNAMGRVWSNLVSTDGLSVVDSVKSTFAEIRGWKDMLDDGDNAYMALAIFSLFVPDTFNVTGSNVSDVDLSPLIMSVQSEIEGAVHGHQFGNREVASLCLGLIGVRSVFSRNMALVERVISSLEQSIQDHCGEASFGACYGLALIAQTLAAVHSMYSFKSDSSSEGVQRDLSWIGRIVAVFVTELKSCLMQDCSVLLTLTACLKSGDVLPDLLKSLSALEGERLQTQESLKQKVNTLFVSLAMCAPSLATVNIKLLQSIYILLHKLPWGTGKGYALPNTVVACVASGLLQQSDVDELVKECVIVVEGDESERGIDSATDALLAISTMQGRQLTDLSPDGSSMAVRGLIKLDWETNDAYRATALLSATLSIVSFPCLGSGGPLFCSLEKVYGHATKESMATLVSILTSNAASVGRAESRDIATLSLGLLGAIKSPATNSTMKYGTVFEMSGSSTQVLEPTRQGTLNFTRLPSPHSETILSGIFRSIQDDNCQATNLPRLLCCIEDLSLPSQFALSFIDPLLRSTPNDSADIKNACVALLVSQIAGRRRAAFDGKEYVKLALRLTAASSPVIRSCLGVGSGHLTIISSLSKMLPKFPSDSIEKYLIGLWSSCIEDLSSANESRSAISYLHSIQALLKTEPSKSGARVSPKTRSTISDLLVRQVFSSLCSVEAYSYDGRSCERYNSLLEAYTSCLSVLPFAELEERQFFGLTNSENASENVYRAVCTMRLVALKYFDQRDRASAEIVKVVAWLARLDISTKLTALDFRTHRHLAFYIAMAARGEDSSSKKAVVMLLLEALHVHGSWTSCMEILAMLVCTWSVSAQDDPEVWLASMFYREADHPATFEIGAAMGITVVLLLEMSGNLGAYCRTEQLNALIFNRLWRIRNLYSEQHAEPSVISRLERMLIRCVSSGTSETDYISLASTSLTAM